MWYWWAIGIMAPFALLGLIFIVMIVDVYIHGLLMPDIQ